MPIATKVTVQELLGGNGAAVLSLPKGCKWLSQGFTKLFKRNFYDRFIRDFLLNFKNTELPQSSSRVLVMGTPGIGKSAFAPYAVYRALRMKKTVVYQHRDMPDEYTVLTPGCDKVSVVDKPPPELKDRKVVYVVDGMEPRGAEAFTLLVSSPNKRRVHEWVKFGESYFFPVWTFDELKLLNTHCFNSHSESRNTRDSVELTDSVLAERFEKAGGIPRTIFREEQWAELDTKMDDSANEVVKKVDGVDLRVGQVFHIPHKAIHLIVDMQTFTVVGLQYASPWVQQLVYNSLVTYERTKLLHFMDSTRGRLEIAAFRGTVHETLISDYASKSGDTWEAELLAYNSENPNTGNDSPDRLRIHLSSEGMVHYFDNLTDLSPGEEGKPILWRPKAKNFPATDLLLTNGRSVYFLQCTVGYTHKIVLATKNVQKPGLFEQASMLETRGFDTSGTLNFVHVTEASTKALYTAGTLTLSNDDKDDNDEVPANGKKSAKAKAREAAKLRVRQWVVGISFTE